jgi:ligand-binding sensor domain-containing protein
MIRHKKKLIIATFDKGLQRKRGDKFVPVANSPRFVNALLSVGKDLYIGSAVGLFRWRGKAIERVPLGLPSEHINALAVSKTGTLWIATSRGVASLKEGRVRLLTRAHGLPSRIAYSVAVTDDDALWIGTAAGALRIHGDEKTVFSQEKGTLPHDWVTSLWAHGNDVYAGTYDSGVARLKASGSSKALAGLEHTWVNPAGISVVDGALAIATLGDGLWFHDGTAATRAPRLPSNDVTAILRAGDELWVGTRGGLATLVKPGA